MYERRTMNVTPPPTERAAERADRPPRPTSRLLGALQRFFLPASCLACGQPLGAGRQLLGLCLPCRGKLRLPPAGCSVCGGPLDGAPTEAGEAGAATVCRRCRKLPPAFERLWAVWSYEGPAAAVIGGLKYRRLDYLGTHLADVMAEAMGEGPARASLGTTAGGLDAALVVPVPLHWRRRLTRGFNQAERIARPLAARLGLPFAQLLRRRRATRSQARLGRAERLANPAGAFAVRRSARRLLSGLPGRSVGVEQGDRERRPGGLDGAHVLLVDDVATTGATLDAAARTLRIAGARRVTAIVAARTPEDSY